jgi:hypothetical protein
MLAESVPISLATVSKAATMLAKLLLKPTLSLLMPGTGKFTFIPETLTLMLDVMVGCYLAVGYLSLAQPLIPPRCDR